MTDGHAPQYLAPLANNGHHRFGKLVYSAKEKMWIIVGEPSAVEMAKRLFPGSHGLGAGKAKFPATKRAAGDLNWFMLRFPLRITGENLARWNEARAEALHHAEVRLRFNAEIRSEPTPEGFGGKLMGFQEQGLAYLLNNERCLLADEMALGKTPTSLAWIHRARKFPVLIVTPPHLLAQWAREIDRFLPGVAHVTLRGLKPYDPPNVPIYLTHYLLLNRWEETLRGLAPRAIIFDEVQELRRTGTYKYSAASALATEAENCVGLSGTPIYNHGGEIWNVLNIVEYHCLGAWDAFTREWCTGWGNEVVAKPEVLGDYLRREGLMLRRTKAQVLPDLPPKRRVVQHIDSDEDEFARLIRSAVALAGRIELEKNPLVKGQMTEEAINQARQATGIAKAPFVAAFARGLIESGERVLLFAWHHAVWDIYAEELADLNPVRVTGLETLREKDEAVRAFTEKGAPKRTDLMFISLRTATGLNLQQATCVVFGELDWSPAVHSQAEDRVHRPGLKDSLLCYYLTSDEGTDEDMMEALGLKVSQFLGLMGDTPETEEDRALAQNVATKHMQGVISKLKARASVRHPTQTTLPEVPA